MKIKTIGMAMLALFVGASVAQAVNLYSQTDGAWTDSTTVWNTIANGSGTYQAPAYTTNTGQGDNLQFYDAITVGATDTVSVRALTMNAGGSISVASGGNVYLNKEVIYKAASAWDTSSGYTFNSLGGQRYAYQQYDGNATWIHNGDLNLNDGADANDAIKLWARGNDNSSVTLTGTGLLTLEELEIGIGANTISAFVDRDLTTELIEYRGTGGPITLDLMSGTTTTDDLFALNTNNIVNFSGADAVLKVLSTDLSATAANNAITAGYITSGAGTLGVSEAGGYTMVAIPEPATLGLIALSGLGLIVFRRHFAI